MRQTKYTVVLTEEERAHLHTLIGQGTAPARLLTHARILLKADHSDAGPAWTDMAIAGALEIHHATVQRVRRSFVDGGLEMALHRKSPDRVYPRMLDGAAEAHLVALACGTPPVGRARWSLRLLADELVRLEVVETISHETVRRTFEQTRSNPG